MQISIRNVLGIERADLAAAPLCLLAGLNGAGKSSIITATAAALTGQPLPGGILKKEAKTLVHDGADGGRVIVKGEAGQVSISWPACEPTSEGKAPWASPFAAGALSLLDLDVKERAKVLAKYLKTEPTKADLVQALRDTEARFVAGGGAATEAEAEAMKPLGLSPTDQRDAAIYRIVEKIWREVEVSGFDGAHAAAAKTGSELKGAWRQVTGEAYGSDKGAKWQHKDADLAGDLVPEGKDAATYLAAEAEAQRKVVEKTIQMAAVSTADVERLQAIADDLPAREEAEEAAKVAKDKARETSDAWNAKARPLAPMSCPHCGCGVVVENGKLVPVSDADDPEAVAAAIKAQQAYDEGKAADRAAFDAAYAAHKAAEAAVKEAKEARRKIDELQGGQPTTQDDVTAAKAKLAQFERALQAIKQQAEAAKIHRQVDVNQLLTNVLAPDGIRKAKLGRVLEAFNGGPLAQLCDTAGWAPVTVGADLEIRYGRRLAREPYSSESQVMRTRVTLQVAMAQLDGSACVLIDRADKLDPKGRKGLTAVLMEAKLPAVLAMMMAKPEQLPNVAAAGVGDAWWVRDGVAVPRAEALPAPVQQAAE